MIETGNIFASIAKRAPEEETTALLTTPHIRVESIVSHGHTTPEGFWYDQDWAEWVVVLRPACSKPATMSRSRRMRAIA
jgi:cupin 2 domain-containing protein